MELTLPSREVICLPLGRQVRPRHETSAVLRSLVCRVGVDEQGTLYLRPKPLTLARDSVILALLYDSHSDGREQRKLFEETLSARTTGAPNFVPQQLARISREVAVGRRPRAEGRDRRDGFGLEVVCISNRADADDFRYHVQKSEQLGEEEERGRREGKKRGDGVMHSC